jgi:hypothetical protein
MYKQEGTSEQVAEQQLRGCDRRSLCKSILVNGHVQTFVDFFYLTHRPGPVQGNLINKHGAITM